jgi:hypothetical protein
VHAEGACRRFLVSEGERRVWQMACVAWIAQRAWESPQGLAGTTKGSTLNKAFPSCDSPRTEVRLDRTTILIDCQARAPLQLPTQARGCKTPASLESIAEWCFQCRWQRQNTRETEREADRQTDTEEGGSPPVLQAGNGATHQQTHTQQATHADCHGDRHTTAWPPRPWPG